MVWCPVGCGEMELVKCEAEGGMVRRVWLCVACGVSKQEELPVAEVENG